jgi:ACS family D-galactonate transporter-like MFS transporter
MCLGWLFFNAVRYGLLTWAPTYLAAVHGLDIKQLGGSLFFMFLAGFDGELAGGQLADVWAGPGGRPNLVFKALFGVAAIVSTISIFLVAFMGDAMLDVIPLSTALFFLRWCGLILLGANALRLCQHRAVRLLGIHRL